MCARVYETGSVRWLVVVGSLVVSSAAAQPTMTAQLGASLRNRIGEVELDNGQVRRYELEAYSELVARVTLRPMGASDTLARGLETRTWFAHSLNLDTASAGNDTDSNFVRFGADFGWLGPATRKLELGLAFGFVFDGYYLGARTEFPNARYLSLRPALRVRHQIREEKLALDFDVGYRAVVFHRGMTDRFGSELQVRAFDMSGALTGQLAAFAWGLRLTWVSYLLEFGGMADDVLARSGSDHSIRMELSVGWKLDP